jgi:PAS domain S-box-containing protein
MNGQYAYTPTIWPSFFTTVLLITLAVYSGRRRSVPGAAPFMIACLFAATWAAGSVMEYTAVGFAANIFWFKFEAIWQVPIVTVITCFFLEYAWPGRWLTRRNLILLSIPCVLAVGLILTDNLLHWGWSSFTFHESIQPNTGLGGWLIMAYAVGGLEVLNLIVLGWLFLRFPQQRWPVVIMLVGQLGGRTIYLLDKTNFIQSVLPVDLLGMTFEFLMYALALFGFRILDPISLARQKMIEQLRAGMAVMDPQGNIVSLNPSAQAILGLPEKQLLNRPIHEFLPIGDEMTPTGQAEIRLGNGEDVRYYQLEESLLSDWRGLEAGLLLMLSDVTEQKQSQAQLLEQQRALAMLQEREQLARELHDSIGQMLGYASLKMSATRRLIADGKLAKADEQLAHLENSLTEAHADVREYILNLRIAPIGDEPFFPALQTYLDGFCQNYGIRVEVSIGPNVDEGLFAPEVHVQLFRILQEALSNARKHARTNSVRVSFERREGLVRVRIQDHGRGFDPQQASAAGGDHYGLRIMRERAEQFGGLLRVQSAPGEGTCVEMDVPVSGKTETR